MSAIVQLLEGKVVADSRDVAGAFGKLHKNVMQSVDGLLKLQPDLGLKFQPKVYPVATGDGGTRHVRCFLMTRTGFMLLVMGFGGAKALALKLEWIDAFERMEAALAMPAVSEPDVPPIVDMEDQRGALAFVREARILGGRVAGRRAWVVAGLPDVFDDEAPAPIGSADPEIADWLEERVEMVPGTRTAASWLYNDYRAWCGRGDREAVTMKRFAGALTALGIRSFKSNQMQRLGVRLRL